VGYGDGSLVCGTGLIWLNRAAGTLSYFGAWTMLGDFFSRSSCTNHVSSQKQGLGIRHCMLWGEIKPTGVTPKQKPMQDCDRSYANSSHLMQKSRSRLGYRKVLRIKLSQVQKRKHLARDSALCLLLFL
jgi:hypothetical protein